MDLQYSERRIPAIPTSQKDFIQAVVKMVEGNPGATQACMELCGGKEQTIETMLEGVMDISRLDDQGIYGSNIWIAYKDLCEFDVDLFREKIRSYKLREEIKDLPGFVEHTSTIPK